MAKLFIEELEIRKSTSPLFVTTQAIGEEGRGGGAKPPATTWAIGEEGNRGGPITTQAIGEEGNRGRPRFRFFGLRRRRSPSGFFGINQK